MRHVRLVLRLVQRVDRCWHRARRLAQPWHEAVHQRRRLELQLLRLLVVEVRVHRRHRQQQARLQGQLWLLMVDRHLRRLVQLVRRPRAQERRQSRQLRSLVRLLELRWCTREAASRRL